jgi:uncharacterized protein YrzB (UPF0473 family)
LTQAPGLGKIRARKRYAGVPAEGEKMDNQEELDYTPDLITLQDEAGVEHECEVIDAADYNGEHYLAVVPYVADPEKMLEEDAQVVIMRTVEENGEEFLDIVDDDEELAAVSEVFASRLEELYDIEL